MLEPFAVARRFQKELWPANVLSQHERPVILLSKAGCKIASLNTYLSMDKIWQIAEESGCFMKTTPVEPPETPLIRVRTLRGIVWTPDMQLEDSGRTTSQLPA